MIAPFVPACDNCPKRIRLFVFVPKSIYKLLLVLDNGWKSNSIWNAPVGKATFKDVLVELYVVES